jgi:hypothetical protein
MFVASFIKKVRSNHILTLTRWLGRRYGGGINTVKMRIPSVGKRIGHDNFLDLFVH